MRTLIRSPGRVLETLFAIAGLFLLTDAVLSVERTDRYGFNVDQFEGDAQTRLLFIVLYAVTFVLLVVHRREVTTMIKRGGWAWLLLGLAVASAGWSIAPEVTLRRAAALMGATSFGLYLGTRFTRRELILLLTATLGLVICASYLYVKMGPGIVPAGGHKGLWRGAFGQKNGLARILVLEILCFGFISRTERYLRFPAYGAIFICLAMLVRTGSATGFLMPIALLGLVPPFVMLRRKAPAALPLLSVILAVGILVMLWGFENFHSITESLDRDPSLTGRTELWAGMVDEIKTSPWVGHGYAGFWLGFDGPSAHVWGKIAWQPLHGHNGYLDVVADLGFLGLVFLLALMARSFGRARALLRRDRDPSAMLPVLFMCFLLLYNVTESAILRSNSIFWPLFVAICVVLPKAPRRQRLSRSQVRTDEPVFVTGSDPVLLEPAGAGPR